MGVCAWCGQSIGGVLGLLSGSPAPNFGMCSGCLRARLAELPHPMAKREIERARRMHKCGRSSLHIGRVLGVSEPSVRAALGAA